MFENTVYSIYNTGIVENLCVKRETTYHDETPTGNDWFFTPLLGNVDADSSRDTSYLFDKMETDHSPNVPMSFHTSERDDC